MRFDRNLLKYHTDWLYILEELLVDEELPVADLVNVCRFSVCLHVPEPEIKDQREVFHLCWPSHRHVEILIPLMCLRKFINRWLLSLEED